MTLRRLSFMNKNFWKMFFTLRPWIIKYIIIYNIYNIIIKYIIIVILQSILRQTDSLLLVCLYGVKLA
jgi:hypothetical protein